MTTNKISPVAGEAVASFLKRINNLSAASRLGVQKKDRKGWKDIPLSYRIQDGDFIRIKEASGGSTNAIGLREIVSLIVKAQRK